MRDIVFAAIAAFGLAGSAQAASLVVTSYDMPNGDGQTVGGSWNYWDKAYNGSGCVTCDGAALSGGTGDLTDGFAPAGIFLGLENVAGTGPYVGWYISGSLNPTLTFQFADAPTVTGIRIHLDNSNVGGVRAPASILVNGVAQGFTSPALGTAGWVDLTGLSVAGDGLTVQFVQDRGWVFVSEIEFTGGFAGGVPEPASWAMMIAGFGLVGAAARRRRVAAA